MKEWYLKKLAKVTGPYSKEEIFELLTQQRINRESLIRRGRDGDWVRLYTIAHLFKAGSENKKPTVEPQPTQPEPKRQTVVAPFDDIPIDIPSPRSSPAPMIAALIIIPLLLLSFVLVLTASKESGKNDPLSDSTNSVKPKQSTPVKKTDE